MNTPVHPVLLYVRVYKLYGSVKMMLVCDSCMCMLIIMCLMLHVSAKVLFGLD